jgi:hypothetical protein
MSAKQTLKQNQRCEVLANGPGEKRSPNDEKKKKKGKEGSGRWWEGDWWVSESIG